MRVQPLIAVRDVAASSRWYQKLLGCESGHGGSEYERLIKDGEPILQLHAWGAHDHPNLADPDAAPNGYGVLLWFQTDAFDAAIARARALRAEIIQEPFVNPNAGTSNAGCAIRTATWSCSPAGTATSADRALPAIAHGRRDCKAWRYFGRKARQQWN